MTKVSAEIPVFDYKEQEYFDSKGNIVNIEYDNFPCIRCKSPSEFQRITSSSEVYKCISCNHLFHVS